MSEVAFSEAGVVLTADTCVVGGRSIPLEGVRAVLVRSSSGTPVVVFLATVIVGGLPLFALARALGADVAIYLAIVLVAGATLFASAFRSSHVVVFLTDSGEELVLSHSDGALAYRIADAANAALVARGVSSAMLAQYAPASPMSWHQGLVVIVLLGTLVALQATPWFVLKTMSQPTPPAPSKAPTSSGRD